MQEQPPPQLVLSAPKPSEGIAILLTLAITVFIALIVVRGLEKTTLETRMIANEKSRYTINTMASSVYRLLVNGILLYGANRVFRILDDYELDSATPVPINPEDGHVRISHARIWSMDHFFFINANYHLSNEISLNNKRILSNIITQHPNWNQQTAQTSIDEFIGALTDWKDSNTSEVNTNNLIGAEQYINATIPFRVKNSALDLITEIKILPAFQGLGLIQKESDLFRLPLRFHKNTSLSSAANCPLGNLNLNMLPKQKVADIFEAYITLMEDLVEDQSCNYETILTNKDLFLEVLTRHYEQQKIEDYSIPLNKDSKWQAAINRLGIDRGLTRAQPFFSSRSDFIGITFRLHVGGLSREIVSHLKLNYAKASDGTPKEIEIRYYHEK